MMKIRFPLAAACLLTLPAMTAYPHAEQQETNSSTVRPTHGVVIERYCMACHNDTLRTADIVLSGLDLSDVSKNTQLWERVARKLRTREMPPAGRPRPDDLTYEALTRQITADLDRVANATPNPGRGALHRLNRTEYANVIRDLLALDIDVSKLLPPDDSSYGFDNVADVLRVSPLLMEQYLSAARKISRAAVGSLAIRPVTDTYNTENDLTQNYHLDGLPFGTRGGKVVRHYFPLDAEYEFRGFLERTQQQGIRGLAEPHDIEVVIDGERVAIFNVGGPEFYKQTGNISTVVGVTKAFTADEIIRVRVPVSAGFHSVAVTFIQRPPALTQDLRRPFLSGYRANPQSGLPHIDRITVSGPYDATGSGDTPSRRRILECRPEFGDGPSCAKTIIRTLARGAFRRPVTDADVAVLLPLFELGNSQGGFESGIETVLRRILVDPEFIFRAEYDPIDIAPDTAYSVSDMELASRLSFFLWSSAPDDELLDVSERGMLRDPIVLEQQMSRMLNDPRSNSLVSNFAGQWLHIRNVSSVQPTPSEFPDFDDNLRQAFRRETELFVESIIREDRSVIDLLNADYTFVNERLARHYGIPDIYGDRFRRVRILDESRRGLLGHGSVLTVTSYPNRTSPVIRGKWILENVLGSPPPPPPPDVPDLEDNPPGQLLAMRERMEHHRRNPVCASCHARMDPLGLAMENFDATGRWREYEGATSIDVSAVLQDGTAFSGPKGLREILLSRREEFVMTVTTKLLTFALGRGIEHFDEPTIRSILRQSKEHDYSFSSLLVGIVKSVPFQMRRSVSASQTSVTSRTAG